MKNKLIYCIVFFFPFFTHDANGDNIRSVKAQVSRATVYLRGAQVSCTSDFTVLPGMNQFVFEDISPALDQKSIQASAKGNLVIMDVKFETKYNEGKKNPSTKLYDKALKSANDSLVMLNFEIEELNEQLSGLATEKNILLNNRLLKGESLRDTLDMFKDGIEFLRQRLINIGTETTTIKKKLFYRNEKKQMLDSRIADLNKIKTAGEEPVQESTNTIVVTAYAEAPAAAEVSVTFFVEQAAWLPAYDLRANSNKTIDLFYKAELRQQTGMDWKNVSLTLSTGNPSQSTVKPELSPFYLSFIQNIKGKYENEMRETQAAAAYHDLQKSSKDEILDAPTLAAYTSENEKMIQTEYDIKLKYSIPNDPNIHVVAIQNKTLKSTYKYSAVPKLDLNTYLLAEINNWGEMNLLPGNSRIYFDGNYLGTSALNPEAAVDTLSLSLGRDRAILLSRKKLKDKTKERVIIDEKSITLTYEITVRNTKSFAIALDVTDQIPISTDPDIKIALIDGDGSELNEETGMMIWDVSLKANESKKLKFTYEVRVPKNKRLAGL
ncbi:MAG TPA: DUF4139 domain-containing protein [Bacteroidia bacterium]|nr:DUF4139 domain-containing protein [Bacteroidia bacterium]